MAKKRMFFPVFHNNLELLEDLTDEECGQLLRMLGEYSQYGVVPDVSGCLRVVFRTYRTAIDLSNAQYQKQCEKNRENIKKRWNSQGKNDTSENDCIPNDTTVYESIQPNTVVNKSIQSNTNVSEIEPKNALPSNTTVNDGIRPNTTAYETYQDKIRKDKKGKEEEKIRYDNKREDTIGKGEDSKERGNLAKTAVSSQPVEKAVDSGLTPLVFGAIGKEKNGSDAYRVTFKKEPPEDIRLSLDRIGYDKAHITCQNAYLGCTFFEDGGLQGADSRVRMYLEKMQGGIA